MARGVSPGGRHYFPAFPYASFRLMKVEDLLDLRAFLMSLPPVRSPEREPALRLPLAAVARRGVGLWKRLALAERDGRARSPARCVLEPRPLPGRERRTLRRVPHAAEPADGAGRVAPARRRRAPRRGGPGPEPARAARAQRYEDAADLVAALQFGETYGYDKLSSGGMGAIQENLAQLPESDLRAMADYLVTLE